MKERIVKQGKTVSKVIDLFIIGLLLIFIPTVRGMASNVSSEQQFRQLYLKLLENGDNSQQDISELNLPYMTCWAIAEDVKKNEGFLPYHCYNEYHLIEIDEVDNSLGEPYLLKFHMTQTDEGFQERYASAKAIVTQVQNKLDEKMTDLDKVLWIHEYVVENLNYKNTGATGEHLGGTTLVNGYGVCEGYAGAMMIFLKAENIPCETISGGNHEWVAAKIDGEWYQIDPTWDDTCSNSVGTHYFLMRNDKEFKETLSKKHSQTMYSDILKEEATDSISTSAKYTDWYVHDVWNRMYYYDGYWYYVSHNEVRKNNIQGTEESVLFQGTNLKITGIEEGVLSFTNNGTSQMITLENAADTTVTTMPTVTKSAIATVTIGPTVSESRKENTPTPTIKVGKPTIKSVTNKKGRKVKIVLKKKVSGAKGYEVVYSKDKKFKKSVKKVRFTGTSKTIGKLSKNKTYYIKVRAYKKDSMGNRVYGSYSKVEKVKIRE